MIKFLCTYVLHFLQRGHLVIRKPFTKVPLVIIMLIIHVIIRLMSQCIYLISLPRMNLVIDESNIASEKNTINIYVYQPLN